MHEGTKKAMSQRTGRIADLPPQIYNNPTRMNNGKWILLNEDGTVPNQMPVIQKEPVKPRDPKDMPEHIKRAMGITDEPEPTEIELPIENPIEAVINDPKPTKTKTKKTTK